MLQLTAIGRLTKDPEIKKNTGVPPVSIRIKASYNTKLLMPQLEKSINCELGMFGQQTERNVEERTMRID